MDIFEIDRKLKENLDLIAQKNTEISELEIIMYYYKRNFTQMKVEQYYQMNKKDFLLGVENQMQLKYFHTMKKMNLFQMKLQEMNIQFQNLKQQKYNV